MNYHTGRGKDTHKVVVIQMVRDVHRLDVSENAEFSFPLRKHYDKAFNTPEGWLDSNWHEKPTMCTTTMPSNETVDTVNEM
jgi:hypothetical protein